MIDEEEFRVRRAAVVHLERETGYEPLGDRQVTSLGEIETGYEPCRERQVTSP